MNRSEDSLVQRTAANYPEQTLAHRNDRSSANAQVCIFLFWRGNAMDLAPETGWTLETGTKKIHFRGTLPPGH